MKLTGPHDARCLAFTDVERNLLTEVFAAVAQEIRGSERTDPVTERLFPAAYEDAGLAAEFRGLTETDLRDERMERLERTAREVEATAGQVPLSQASADRWIRVLNDTRLVLGTRLGVTDDYDHDFGPQDADAAEKSVYLWLTAVQDAIVTELLG